MPGPSKLNQNENITIRMPLLTDLFFFADPNTGDGSVNELSTIIALIASATSAPVKIYADRTALLANTTIPTGFLAFVSDDGGRWALYLYLAGDRSLIASYQLLLSEKIVWVDCGVFNTDALPAAGSGSGFEGQIKKGNTFDAGDSGTGPDGALGVTIDGIFYPQGTTFRALQDTPTTVAHFRIHS